MQHCMPLPGGLTMRAGLRATVCISRKIAPFPRGIDKLPHPPET
jgi:hypothetical protein